MEPIGRVLILVGIIIVCFGFVGREWLNMRDFLNEGDRFTQLEGASLSARIKALENNPVPPMWVRERLFDLRDEQKRIQLQIDRLEGHKPKNYTEDH